MSHWGESSKLLTFCQVSLLAPTICRSRWWGHSVWCCVYKAPILTPVNMQEHEHAQLNSTPTGKYLVWLFQWTHALTFSLPSIATRLFSCWWSQAQRGCYISRWLSSAKASPTDTHASTGHTYSHPCTCRSPRMQDVCSQMSSLQKTCCLLISTHTYTLFLSHLQILI